MQDVHEQAEQERVDLSRRMRAGLIHADDGLCELFQFAVSSLSVAGGGCEQQGVDQVDRRILAGDDPGKKVRKKVDMAEGAFAAVIQIKRVHHIGEDHDKVSLSTVDRSVADIHGAGAGADQIDLHAGVQMFAETVPVRPALDCSARDGIDVKRDSGHVVFHYLFSFVCVRMEAAASGLSVIIGREQG